MRDSVTSAPEMLKYSAFFATTAECLFKYFECHDFVGLSLNVNDLLIFHERCSMTCSIVYTSWERRMAQPSSANFGTHFSIVSSFSKPDQTKKNGNDTCVLSTTQAQTLIPDKLLSPTVGFSPRQHFASGLRLFNLLDSVV